MKRRVRIIDIAAHAGVSKGTVDRVIHKRGNVSSEAREKVLEAIDILGFRRNRIASALAYNRNWKVACLLPSPTNEPFWFYPTQGIEQALENISDYGYSLEFFYFPDESKSSFVKQSHRIIEDNFDLVIVAPLFKQEAEYFFDRCADNQLPYIQINTMIDRCDPEFICYIGQHSYHSGVLGAKLLDFGLLPNEAVMILHLETGVYNSEHLLAKEKGFEDYFKNHAERNIQVIKSSFESPRNQVEMHSFISNELEQNPTIKGIFVTTSKLHFLMDVMDESTIAKLKFVGFDLIEENLNYLYGEKIHFLINQNPQQQGYKALINGFNYLTFKSDIKKEQYLPLHIVMPENVKYYLDQNQVSTRVI